MNMNKETNRAACKKCGYTGHLTFQCRNFLKVSVCFDFAPEQRRTLSAQYFKWVKLLICEQLLIRWILIVRSCWMWAVPAVTRTRRSTLRHCKSWGKQRCRKSPKNWPRKRKRNRPQRTWRKSREGNESHRRHRPQTLVTVRTRRAVTRMRIRRRRIAGSGTRSRRPWGVNGIRRRNGRRASLRRELLGRRRGGLETPPNPHQIKN